MYNHKQQRRKSKATDDMANALTNQMQIKIANRGNAAKMKKADLRYSTSVQHASKMEKEEVESNLINMLKI